MTRALIEQTYQVEDGRIRTPGQFEGEAVYLPHFYEVFLDGLWDFDTAGEGVGFYITAEDKKEFPELKGRRTVKLRVRSDGFVVEL